MSKPKPKKSLTSEHDQIFVYVEKLNHALIQITELEQIIKEKDIIIKNKDDKIEQIFKSHTAIIVKIVY